MDNTIEKDGFPYMWKIRLVYFQRFPDSFPVKSYNLESLTVGRTEDPTISRMTIETNSDEETYEQDQKQLNRMVEVIRVIDFTEVSVVMQELMFIKVKTVHRKIRQSFSRSRRPIRQRYVIMEKTVLLLEFVHTAHKNTAIIQFLRSGIQFN